MLASDVFREKTLSVALEGVFGEEQCEVITPLPEVIHGSVSASPAWSITIISGLSQPTFLPPLPPGCHLLTLHC